jgi:uncharacterized membrane protein YbhN (UPF0104 family)
VRPSPRARPLLTGLAALGVVGVMVTVLAGRRDEFVTALHAAPVSLLVLVAALQVLALVSRTEAWMGCVTAAGGRAPRRCLYRASSMGVVGGLINGQLAVAARIAALRRSAPADSPRVPAMIAAEFPIVAVEATLAALTSFTLVGPLGLPWWVPLVCLTVVGALVVALRRCASRRGRELWTGLASLRTSRSAVRLVAFVLVAVVAQIARNWLVLNAVGAHVSVFDAIAVLIAIVSLSQLPIGPGVGAAAALLILGPHGVAAVAAAGVLLTATGTAGALVFAAWALVDRAHEARRLRRRPRLVQKLLAGMAALPAPDRRALEIAYFGGLSQLQLTRALA